MFNVNAADTSSYLFLSVTSNYLAIVDRIQYRYRSRKMNFGVSDIFSFQNNGIKKCTCCKTIGSFLKNNGFFKSNVIWHNFTHDLFWL